MTLSTKPSTTDAKRAGVAPWLMLAGLGGMVAALCGLPVPVLSCLLLVGLGADADLARRAALIGEESADRVTLPLRGLHALLYVVLYVLAWGAMFDAATTLSANLLLTVDLLVSLFLIFAAGRRLAR